ncbi:MAG: divergent polysaccharide deacetylase family protein [Spirochaetales bacterium]
MLVGLLVVIAVLLGVLITLLPDAVDSGGTRAASETRGQADGSRSASPSRGTESGGGTGPGGVSDPDGSGAPAEGDRALGDDGPHGDADGRAGSGEAGATDAVRDGDVTEAYPGEEGAPVRPDVDTEDEYWWLPDQTAPPSDRGALVLVLDDAGNTLDAYEDFLAFPGPLAVAVLPQLDYSVHASAMAAAAGKEILLHQPMAATNGANPGPGAIEPGLTVSEIRALLSDNLATVPGAIGVNNHMGSLATTEPALMRTVLESLSGRGLFFLDSRTSAQTVARTVAAEVGIPFAERHVFLDNERTREAILGSLRHALELAHHGEPVVMIGHVTVPLLAEVLNETYPVIVANGYEFARISELAKPVGRLREGG